jgi:high-affinity iron transporter
VVATFVIFLREGIEASMIVAILLAYLNKIDQRQHFRDVFVGVGVALGLAFAGGAVAYITLKAYAGSRVQTIFETGTFLLAAVVLTYMTFWMRNHSRGMSKELRARTDSALNGGARWGLGLLAFQAVGREGLETVVFTLAIAFASTARHVLIGAVAGLVVALGIAFAMYRLGHRINIAVFFKVVGGLLMVFAAGLLVDAVENLQGLGWLPFLRHPMWSTEGVLSEGSTLGDLVHSFFGYASQPTPLQLVVYVVYVALAMSAFLGLWSRLARRRREVRPVPVVAE